MKNNKEYKMKHNSFQKTLNRISEECGVSKDKASEVIWLCMIAAVSKDSDIPKKVKAKIKKQKKLIKAIEIFKQEFSREDFL